MESLFNYGSDEENDDGQENDAEQRFESDTNYDHVTMDMSEDSSSSVTSKAQIITDVSATNRVTRDGNVEASEGDKSSGFSSSDSCCSSGENDFSSLRDKLFQKQDKNYKSSESNSGDRYNHNRLDDSKKQIQQKASYSKSSKDISGRDSDDDDSEEENEEVSRYRDRDTRTRVRDRKRHRSRSRDRPHTYDRHRSRSPTNDRHHSSKHYSHRSRHSMSRERDSRGRNRSRSREKPRSSYDSKRQSKLTILEKLGIELKVPDSGSVTPQMALQKSMKDQIAKVKTATGIALPSYYNPIAVNPTKYAEQMQKRKLLWGGGQKQGNNQSTSGVESSNPGTASSAGSATGPASLWQGARFSQDEDGKLTAKFKRLMGIKQNSGEAGSGAGGTDLIKKQEEMFNSMEMQYEVARVATHTHRGLGLGFGVHQYPR